MGPKPHVEHPQHILLLLMMYLQCVAAFREQQLSFRFKDLYALQDSSCFSYCNRGEQQSIDLNIVRTEYDSFIQGLEA